MFRTSTRNALHRFPVGVVGQAVVGMAVTVFGGGLSLACFCGAVASAVAGENPTDTRRDRNLDAFVFNQNFEPPGEGRPKSSRASGTRTGSCSSTLAARTPPTNGQPLLAEPIQAILPKGHFGLTLQAHPQVFLNFNGDRPPFVLLRFEDQTGTYSERVTLPVHPQQSVQGFALPRDRTPLAIGKTYQWTLLVACDGQINPYHPLFKGWVQRVAPTPTTLDLQRQPMPEQIQWYNRHGYWYDTVTTLYQTLQTTPTDTATAHWTQLLEWVNRNNDQD